MLNFEDILNKLLYGLFIDSLVFPLNEGGVIAGFEGYGLVLYADELIAFDPVNFSRVKRTTSYRFIAHEQAHLVRAFLRF